MQFPNKLGVPEGDATTASETDPTVTDDASKGYVRGDFWINTITPEAFQLLDATVGAAVWSSTTAPGGVTDHGALTGLGDNDHPQYALATHAARHENGGADEISVAGLSGTLADPQTAAAHAAAHQNGGADEISVQGLSGVLADPQTPEAHAADHQNGGADEINVEGLSGTLAGVLTYNVLDFITVTCLAAFHTFYQLRAAYAGACFRVKRASDSAELDIGFIGGMLDVGALIAHCGVSDGFIVTWYDQSGNGRNVTEATNPPKIWDGTTQNFASFTDTVPGANYHGSAASLRGNPTGPVPQIPFDGVNDILSRADALGLSGDFNWSRLILGGLGVSGGGSAGAVSMGDSAVAAGKYLDTYRDTDSTHITTASGGGGRQWTATALHNTSRMIFSHKSGDNLNLMAAYQNGTLLTPSANPSGSLNLENDLYRIGVANSPGFGVSALCCVMEFQTALGEAANADARNTLNAWMKAHRLPT